MSTTGAARMVTEGGDPVEQRVTPLELFFDLVFVFALTQVTGFLIHHLTWLGMLQAAALLTVLWSSWASYPARSLGDVRLRLGVGTAIRPRVERRDELVRSGYDGGLREEETYGRKGEGLRGLRRSA